jgi:hypothetical protein
VNRPSNNQSKKFAQPKSGPASKGQYPFMMVNMSERDQKQLRALAKETGSELRGLIKYNLHSLKRELEERAKLQRILGMNGIEQYQFFAFGSGLN